MTAGATTQALPDWLQVSVQQFFAQVNWQPPTHPKVEAAIASDRAKRTAPAIAAEPDPSIVAFARRANPLTLSMKVSAYFDNFDWQGQSPLPQRPSAPPRPSAEALLDLELLDNVFQGEGKNTDVSIADFSDFF